jgi:hypothetical protein
MISDWEQSVDVSNQVISKDKNNINGNLYLLVNQIVRMGNHDEFIQMLKNFIRVLNQDESDNVELLLMISRLFSRLCSNNPKIIELT